MIKEDNGSIFTDLPEYSVLIHQCNNKGWLGVGIAKDIANKWPKNFDKYHNYCRAFQDGHEAELLGSFVGYNVSPKMIICNAITQYTVGKTKQQTDYNAWEIVCQKLKTQTKRVNKLTGKNWTLHIPYKIGCGNAGGIWENMLEIFERYFSDSDVDLVIHHY